MYHYIHACTVGGAMATDGAPGSAGPDATPETRDRTVFGMSLLIWGLLAGGTLWVIFGSQDPNAFVALIAAAAAVFGGISYAQTRSDRAARQAALRAFACVSVVCTALGGYLAFHEDGEPRTVTGAELSEEARDMGDGTTATLTVDEKPADDADLSLHLSAEGLGAGTTDCLPRGSLTFSGGDLDDEVSADLEREFTVDLPLDAEGPSVVVRITMAHEEPGCRVGLATEEVLYR